MCCKSTSAICESFVFQGAWRGAEEGREDEASGEEGEEEEEEAVAAAALAALFSKRVMLTRAGSMAPSSPRQAQMARERSSLFSSADKRRRTWGRWKGGKEGKMVSLLFRNVASQETREGGREGGREGRTVRSSEITSSAAVSSAPKIRL